MKRGRASWKVKVSSRELQAIHDSIDSGANCQHRISTTTSTCGATAPSAHSASTFSGDGLGGRIDRPPRKPISRTRRRPTPSWKPRCGAPWCVDYMPMIVGRVT